MTAARYQTQDISNADRLAAFTHKSDGWATIEAEVRRRTSKLAMFNPIMLDHLDVALRSSFVSRRARLVGFLSTTHIAPAAFKKKTNQTTILNCTGSFDVCLCSPTKYPRATAATTHAISSFVHLIITRMSDAWRDHAKSLIFVQDNHIHMHMLLGLQLELDRHIL